MLRLHEDYLTPFARRQPGEEALTNDAGRADADRLTELRLGGPKLRLRAAHRPPPASALLASPDGGETWRLAGEF